MGVLFNILFGKDKKVRKTKKGTFIGDSKYSEEEMNSYGLFEDEKEDVRKGIFNPDEFEDDDE